MKRSAYILSLLLILLCVGCSTPQHTLELINRSESVAEEYPDSALLLIQQVDSRRVRGKQDKARYRLIYSEALYHNQIDSDCDSLTRPLFDYYYYSDCHEERARAMYQHGRVMYNSGNNAEAMYALLEAEKSLQYYDNPRLLGLVHRAKGDIYGSECLYQNALHSYKYAYDIFSGLSLEYHSISSLLTIGELHMYLKKYDIAEKCLNDVITKSEEYGYHELYSCAVDVLCDLYVYTSQYKEIEKFIEVLDSCNPYEGFDIQRYFYKSILYSSLGDKEQALKYLDLANGCQNPNTIEIEYLKSIVYYNIGDNAQAAYWLQQNKIQQEELMLSILELPILNSQIELLKRDMDIAKERAQNLRFRYIIIFLLLISISVGVVLYVRQRMIMQRHEIEKYISMISELKQSYVNSSSKILQEVRSVYGDKLSDINNILEVYYEHGNTSRESSKIVEQVKAIIDSIRNDSNYISQLERLVNLHHDNILVVIKDSNIRLSDKEQRYILYILSGLSNRSICLLLGIDDAALYRIKYKVKNKMNEGGLYNIVDEIFAK